MIRLFTLGEAVIQLGRRRLGPDAELVFAITVYLASHRGRRIPRQTLLEILWPRVPEESRRHNLRQLLYKLRRTGIPCDADGTHVTLLADEVHADYDAYFTPRVADGDTVRLEAPSGEFLAGYAPSFSSAFAEWLEHRRSEVHAQMRRVQLAVLSSCKQRGEWTEVDRLARRVLELDALNEEATLALAEATAMSGSKAAAVAMLDKYVEELGPGAGEIRLPAGVLRKRITLTKSVDGVRKENESLLIGREPMIEEITKAIAGLPNREGSGFWLHGEVGLGKTRLLSEIHRVAEIAGVSVCLVACGTTGSRPLGTLHGLLVQLLALPGALGCGTASYSLLSRFSSGEPLQKSNASPNSRQTEENLNEALNELLESIQSEMPVLLLLDDVHRSDVPSVRVIDRSSRRLASWATLIVMASRTEPDRVLGEQQISDWAVRRLLPLSEEESGRLLDSIARYNVLFSPENRRKCLAIAAGNPLLLEEVFRHWRSQGQTAQLPLSITRAFEQSISQLDSTALRTLQALVLLGRHASFSALEAVLQLPTYVFMESINSLERAHLLGEGPTLGARHPALGEAALKPLGPHIKGLLHHRIGLHLDELFSLQGATSLLADCSAHWRQSGQGRQIARSSRDYARYLLETGLPEDAAKTLEEGADLCDESSDKRSILEQLADVFALTGQWGKVAELSRRIAAIRSSASGSLAHSSAELAAIEAEWHLTAEPRPLLAKVLPCANDPAGGVEHQLHAIALGIALADNASAPDVQRALIAQARALGPKTPTERALRLQAEVIYCTSSDNKESALTAAHELALVASEVSSPTIRLRSLRHAATACRVFGSKSAADGYLLAAAREAERTHLSDQAAIAYFYLVASALNEGDLPTAKTFFDLADRLQVTKDDEITAAYSRVLGARIAVMAGEPSKALEILPSREEILGGKTLRDTSALLAAWTRAQLSADDSFEPSLDDLELLRSALAPGVHSVGADYIAQTVVLGQRRLANYEAASAILEDYITSQRRHKTPLSEELRVELGSDQVAS
jgi:DNA-binding SARP family transcriptional activator